jgi:hypothetical protein
MSWWLPITIGLVRAVVVYSLLALKVRRAHCVPAYDTGCEAYSIQQPPKQVIPLQQGFARLRKIAYSPGRVATQLSGCLTHRYTYQTRHLSHLTTD